MPHRVRLADSAHCQGDAVVGPPEPIRAGEAVRPLAERVLTGLGGGWRERLRLTSFRHGRYQDRNENTQPEQEVAEASGISRSHRLSVLDGAERRKGIVPAAPNRRGGRMGFGVPHLVFEVSYGPDPAYRRSSRPGPAHRVPRHGGGSPRGKRTAWRLCGQRQTSHPLRRAGPVARFFPTHRPVPCTVPLEARHQSGQADGCLSKRWPCASTQVPLSLGQRFSQAAGRHPVSGLGEITKVSQSRSASGPSSGGMVAI